MTITDIDVRLYRVPLAEVLADAMHGDHTHFELVTATLRTNDGRSGTGYTYTGGRGGRAIVALALHDLAPILSGRDPAAVAALHDEMQAHIHYVGRGGVASFAISALDIALWDLQGRAEARPLVEMAGGAGTTTLAYRGGIDLQLPIDELVTRNRSYLDQGFDAVKIKVGRPRLDDDIARVAAVRDAVGPETTLMVDDAGAPRQPVGRPDRRRLARGPQLPHRRVHEPSPRTVRRAGRCPRRARHRR